MFSMGINPNVLEPGQWYPMTLAAKFIDRGMGRNQLYDFLYEHKFIDDFFEIREEYLESGYFLREVNFIERNDYPVGYRPILRMSKAGIEFVQQYIDSLPNFKVIKKKREKFIDWDKH